MAPPGNSTSGPESVSSSQTVFEGRLVRVRVDQVILEGGSTASREVVEHGETVVAVPVDSDANLVLVRQYRHAIHRSLLEAPAGGLERGESPAESVQRELQEETGFLSRNLRRIGGFWLAPGWATEYMHVFLARDLVPSSLESDDDERIVVQKVPIDEFPALIRSGEIRDAKTIAAVCMATDLLDRG